MKVDQFIVHQRPEEVADAVAARLITRIVELQAAQGEASLVLTGGTTLDAVLTALSNSPAVNAIDWATLDVYWADERFVPRSSDERNDRRALTLLEQLKGARLHPMPSAEDFSQPEEGAAAFAQELGLGRQRMPSFDLVLLGIGADAHVGSLFPENPVLHDNRWVAAVRNAPKPPSQRITMSVPLLTHADEIWLIATGAEKSDAIRLTLSERAGLRQAPAAAIRGERQTLLFADVDAAGEYAEAGRIASP
jgi:6-phosphogluconolactonase